MKSRLLIIGASGFVGSRWMAAAGEQFDVIGGGRGTSGAAHWVSIDIADPASVRAAFDAVRPTHVTLLAALSDIDRCEREQELAERINHHGARNVAAECARVGARLLYTSSDAVFDGTRGIYREDDPPTPPNWYGQTKARAERVIAELLPDAVIVRVSLVLGTSGSGGGNSYLDKVIASLREGRQIISPTYEFRNPLDVRTLCQVFLALTQAGEARGIFHAGACDKISRYDLARAIAERLAGDVSLVVAQTAPVPGRAPRGADDFLASTRLAAFFPAGLPTCQQVIERALDGVA